jgi:outer membrane protein TolC
VRPNWPSTRPRWTAPAARNWPRKRISRGSSRLAGTDDQTAGFSDQQRANANVGWRFSLSVFGDLKSAHAVEEQAVIEAERQVDGVRAQVVLANESSRTNAELAGLAEHQVASAEEALRLSQANLQAGTMTTLDVLQAQDAVNQARLRHAEAVVRYNQAQINLAAALGLLNEEHS